MACQVRYLIWVIGFFVLDLGFAANPVVDRLVIEVNSAPYSQRQFELYMALKQGLLKDSQEKDVLELVGRDNWQGQLAEFINDMIVEQESRRLGAFQANPRMINVARETIDKQKMQHQNLGELLGRLAADDVSINRALARVLRVRAFILGKEQRVFDEDVTKEKPSSFVSAPWFTRLHQRIAYRVFEGADAYIEIEPSLLSRGGSR